MVFERAKFMVSFAGAYRRARKNGLDHEDALRGATDDMLGVNRVDLPASVCEMWCDPADELDLDWDGWFGYGPFEITAAHLGLLRLARVGWDGAERGAPMLDPDRPYGRADLLAQLSEVFGTDDADVLGRHHVEMCSVLARVLRHGALRPGHYASRNLQPADIRAAVRGYGDLSDADLGLDAGQIAVEADHLQLLRGMQVRWPSPHECRDRLDTGRFPAATVDPKRPFGDFTYIEVDMARILGVLPPAPTDGPAVFEPGPELAHRLQRRHWQTAAVMQVFLEQAELAPGTYDMG